MRYKTCIPGIFVERPNRFIATVLVDGEPETVHVKNTGRCRELLQPGAVVYLERANNPNRRTAYSLVAVEKRDKLINIDSAAPNQVVAEALAAGLVLPGWPGPVVRVRREVTFGASRLDFQVELAGGGKAFIEVKGATLEEDGAVLFPDAPTVRGVRHLEELIGAVEQNYFAHALFVIQMNGVNYFSPNDRTHLAFGNALRLADSKGVGIHAYDCITTPDSLALGQPVEVRLYSQSISKR